MKAPSGLQERVVRVRRDERRVVDRLRRAGLTVGQVVSQALDRLYEEDPEVLGDARGMPPVRDQPGRSIGIVLRLGEQARLERLAKRIGRRATTTALVVRLAIRRAGGLR